MLPARRRGLVAVIAAVALSLAILAQGMVLDYRFSPKRYPAMAKWAGCQATIASVDTSPGYSQYNPSSHVLLIGVAEDKDVPYYAGLIILFHEVGHCLQDQEHVFEALYIEGGIQAIELDADMRAADLACGLGLDGRTLLREVFIWAHEKYGYDGDWQHGSLAQRMEQGDKAPRCQVARPQA